MCKTKTDLQIQKTTTGYQRGEGRREGKIRGIELRDTKYYCKTDKQQDIWYSTWNYTQYLIITFNGV